MSCQGLYIHLLKFWACFPGFYVHPLASDDSCAVHSYSEFFGAVQVSSKHNKVSRWTYKDPLRGTFVAFIGWSVSSFVAFYILPILAAEMRGVTLERRIQISSLGCWATVVTGTALLMRKWRIVDVWLLQWLVDMLSLAVCRVLQHHTKSCSIHSDLEHSSEPTSLVDWTALSRKNSWEIPFLESTSGWNVQCHETRHYFLEFEDVDFEGLSRC